MLPPQLWSSLVRLSDRASGFRLYEVNHCDSRSRRGRSVEVSANVARWLPMCLRSSGFLTE